MVSFPNLKSFVVDGINYSEYFKNGEYFKNKAEKLDLLTSNAYAFTNILKILSFKDLNAASSPNKNWHDMYLREINRRLMNDEIICKIKDNEKGSVLASRFPQLSSVVIKADFQPGIMNKFTNLRKIEYLGMKVKDRHFITLSHLTTLSSLILKDTANKITSAGIASLSSLTGLTELDLSHTLLNNDEGFAALSYLTNLTSLKLIESDIENCGLKSIASLTKLASLNLNSCQKIAEEGLSNFSQLINLHSLYLAACNITDSAIVQLSTLTNLRLLNLKNNFI